MSTPNPTQYQSTEPALATREALTVFRAHATDYAVVSPVLALINLVAVPQFYGSSSPCSAGS
ncbi:hypothetical protein [Pengzhenrongella phosphoraccumulans]|uniref:hypothetical protein n=1 Tax=Pengzhenrongella phosphoraccumulans TaxID=3114394 RepID=UPI0038908C91